MIELENGYVIGVDRYSYSLMRKTGKNKKTGETTFDYYGYYKDLNGALKAYKNERIRARLRDGSMDLAEAIRRIKESNSSVEQSIRRAVGGS